MVAVADIACTIAIVEAIALRGSMLGDACMTYVAVKVVPGELFRIPELSRQVTMPVRSSRDLIKAEPGPTSLEEEDSRGWVEA